VLAFVRSTADERVLVTVNLSGEPQHISLALAAHHADTVCAVHKATADLTGTTAQVTLSAHATGVFQLR
jgi:hypothetical protein